MKRRLLIEVNLVARSDGRLVFDYQEVDDWHDGMTVRYSCLNVRSPNADVANALVRAADREITRYARR